MQGPISVHSTSPVAPPVFTFSKYVDAVHYKQWPAEAQTAHPVNPAAQEAAS